jgi:hypothetical protein
MNEPGQDGPGTFLAGFGDAPQGTGPPRGLRERGVAALRLLLQRA